MKDKSKTRLKVYVRPLAYFCLLTSAFCLGMVAQAQSYPARPVRIIVGTAPGGGTDFVSRLMAARLTDAVGQQFIVEKDMEDKLQSDGLASAGGTPEQLYDRVRNELETWRKVVTKAGIKIN